MSAPVIIFPVIRIVERDDSGWRSQQQREREEIIRNIQFRACPRLVVDNPQHRRGSPRRRRALPSVFVNRAGS